MELIKAENLILSYEGFTAAKNVDFSLSEGEYLCVVGENGSGKSTLLKTIIGELKPAGGKLTISPEIQKGGIGYLPQQSVIVRDFPATVREVVRSGCIRRDLYGIAWKNDSKKRAEYFMSLLRVDMIADKCFGELSGGQKQRVLLARAMCVSEKILLLDEPVTGLDPDAAHEMYSVIRMLNREVGCAVMMVSHDVHCALREADFVLSMCRGHSFFGTIEEYKTHEKIDDESDEKRHLHDEYKCDKCPHFEHFRVDNGGDEHKNYSSCECLHTDSCASESCNEERTDFNIMYTHADASGHRENRQAERLSMDNYADDNFKNDKKRGKEDVK